MLFHSIVILFKKPVFLVPIAVSWFAFAAVALFFRYAPLDELPLIVFFALLFGAVFFLAYSLCFACAWMLELVQRIEQGKPADLGDSFSEVLSKDAISILPIAILWSIIWFVLIIIKAIASKFKSEKNKPSMEDAAKTLGGANANPFSWLGLGIELFEQLLRMAVFATLPAICWEDKGPGDAIRRAITIIRRHPATFLSIYSFTLIAGAIIFLPLYIFFQIAPDNLPDFVWLLAIGYAFMAWTLSMYLEEMNIALYYLWYLKWEKAGGQGDLSSVEKPDLLDNVPDLA